MIYINGRFLTQQLTGVQRFALELCIKLKEMLPDITIVVPAKGIVHVEIAKKLQVLNIGNNTGVIWEQIDLPFFLKRKKNPLLVNLCNTAPAVYSNQLVAIHDVAFRVNPNWFSKAFVTYYNILIPIILKRCRAILTVSEFSKTEIIKYYGIKENKIFIVNNGIENFFSRKSIIKETPSKIVLAVGSIDPRKNLKKLIKSFNNLKLEHATLVVIGGQNKIFSNQENLDLNESVKFTGRISDYELRNFYCKADVFVYPSLYEGFGLPPLEAMSCGCPVIVSNASSLPEVCGDAAYYINPDSESELGSAIAELLNNGSLANQNIQKGYLQAAKYTWEASCKQLISVIDGLN